MPFYERGPVRIHDEEVASTRSWRTLGASSRRTNPSEPRNSTLDIATIGAASRD